MSRRILLLDAGNTRLKWAVLDTALSSPDIPQPGMAGQLESIHWLDQGAAPYDNISDLPALWQKFGALTACYGVNVAGIAASASLQPLLASIKLKSVWLHASLRACGVENKYEPPESLGADRWAALLAVRQRTSDAALVVSAGSALTVDALNADGQFLGGIIVPGLHIMRQGLAGTTAQVGTQYGKVLAFPNTTADAVETGLVTACTAAIENMSKRVERIWGAQPRVFLSGGDADILKPFLSVPCSIIPTLVLEGVYYLSLEEQLT